MRHFATSSEVIFNRLNKGQKKKGSGHRVIKKEKTISRRKFRAKQKLRMKGERC